MLRAMTTTTTITTAATVTTTRPTRTAPGPTRRTPRTTHPILLPGSPPAPRPAGAPPAVPFLRLLRHEPDAEAPVAASTAPAAPPVLPVPDLHATTELRRRAHQVLSMVLEAVDGRRPLGHVTPHLAPRALRYARAALARPVFRPTGRLTSLHLSRPRPDAVEVAAVHRVGPRARAVAARFEGSPDAPDRWRCVSLRLL